MAFTTSSALFQGVFVEPEPPDGLVQEFLAGVLEYLDKRSFIQEAKDFADWIREGKEVSGSVCRSDLTEALSLRLRSHNIPYVVVADPAENLAYLTRQCDDDMVRDFQNKVLREKSGYFLETDKRTLSNKLLLEKGQDKGLVSINSLDSEQADILRMILDENLEGDAVAADERSDGTWSFTFPGRKAVKRGYRDAVSLAAIAAMLMLQSRGFRKTENARIAANRAAFQKALASGFRKGVKGSPAAWVVGKGRRFLKVTDEGFEYGAMLDNGRIEVLDSASADAPDYMEQLVSRASSIPWAAYTRDANMALLHLAGKGDGSLDFSRSEEDRLIAGMEKNLVLKAVEAAVAKTAADREMASDGHWREKLLHLLEETADVLESVQIAIDEALKLKGQGTPGKEPEMEDVTIEDVKEAIVAPKGYRKDALTAVAAAAIGEHMSLNQYKNAISSIRKMEISQEIAEPKRIRNMETLRETAMDKSETRRESPVRGRDAVTRGG